jgi:hypothetical protein
MGSNNILNHQYRQEMESDSNEDDYDTLELAVILQHIL